MKSRKPQGEPQARPPIATPDVTTMNSGRKPWKKKTPVEAVIAQIERLRESAKAKEEELKQAQRQLQKLDEVLEALRTT